MMRDDPAARRYAEYAWLIDHDHLVDQFGDDFGPGDAGTCGPHNISPQLLEQLRHGAGHHFRMYDDGELYYSGRLVVRGGADPRVFSDQPLADFGMPNAGCTRIRFAALPRRLQIRQEPCPEFQPGTQVDRAR